MSFLERLYLLMEDRNIKKNALCKTLEINGNSFVNWENRGTLPSAEIIIKLANYFGVTSDYLLGLDDVPNRKETVPLELTANSETNLVSNGYKKYYVAFLDILGFKEIVRNNDFEKINALIGKYNKDYILELLMYGLDAYNDTDPTTDSLKIVQFSDSIIISIPSDMYYSFDVLLLVLRNLIADCLLNHGILLRGGIAEGNFYINDNKLFGTALNEAYKLENASAIYPRVIFTEKLLNDYENKCLGSMLCRSITEIDEDGYYFVDYLFSLNFALWAQRKNQIWFERYKNINEDIESAYKNVLAEKTDNHIREKYLWLKKYYEKTQIRIKNYFAKPVAARDSSNSEPIKPNAEHLDDFPTMDEE